MNLFLSVFTTTSDPRRHKYHNMWKYYNILIFLTLNIKTLTSEKVELEQERHKIIIPAKTESCFFIANLVESDIVSVSFLVISFSNGKQHDITFRLKDPDTSRYQNMLLLLDLDRDKPLSYQQES